MPKPTVHRWTKRCGTTGSTMDGASGKVIKGQAALAEASVGGDVNTFSPGPTKPAAWVFAPTPTARRRRKAREFGAEGIGLCRTEHMFMQEERLPHVRNMIMAATWRSAGPLAKLLPFQRYDFDGMFRAMEGLPVTIRLLDPPLHEFLPRLHRCHGGARKLRLTGAAPPKDRQAGGAGCQVKSLAEANPMLGTRGCRLGSSSRRSTRCRFGPSWKRPATSSRTPARCRTSRS